jgi:isochorismate synthase
MTDIFLKLRENLKFGFPFAVYCKPGSNDVTGVFQTGPETHPFTDFTKKGFVFAPFAKGKYCFIPAEAADIIVTALESKGNSTDHVGQPVTDPDAKTAFEALAAKSISAIRDGKFDKLVISRKESVKHDREAIGHIQELA